jgi:hypothetical protein
LGSGTTERQKNGTTERQKNGTTERQKNGTTERQKNGTTERQKNGTTNNRTTGTEGTRTDADTSGTGRGHCDWRQRVLAILEGIRCFEKAAPGTRSDIFILFDKAAPER